MQQGHIVVGGETNDSHHQAATPTRFKRVQMEHFQQLCSLFGEGDQHSIRLHLHGFVEQHAEWIGYSSVLFDRIAHVAGVNEVVIV